MSASGKLCAGSGKLGSKDVADFQSNSHVRRSPEAIGPELRDGASVASLGCPQSSLASMEQKSQGSSLVFVSYDDPVAAPSDRRLSAALEDILLH